ncbi:MAG: hypothetical protein GWM90_25520 [Gemmatimonadetes bacterium]|nr:hypothetical protein [Gemmatimonadota bacterium]NIQ58179.1 hypothetical protein [Gemmatimonadota bacterium]NIU78385.1 hypothetical protein [Gammaproteobacteria bacterium]NIX47315.1 hypothetical protein [Gemmatimonadota bacterium]NIY11690.1 hypothetical protein [Gemmatimonadota bacterium]
MTDRDRKFRQAAFVYLHVAILYEAAAYAMAQNGVLPTGGMGPPELWLVLGAVVGLAVFWALLHWKNAWFARAIWALHALRLPALISGAFLRGTDGQIHHSFYLTAIVVVVINLAFLARAGWDL